MTGISAIARAISAPVLIFAVVVNAPVSAQTTASLGESASARTASVDGFRSAEFGMDKSQVLAAIDADFGLSGESVVEGQNTIERTSLLSISSSGVLEGGGVAQVSYVFGYTSQTLIQVGISWGADTDPSMTEAQIVANGDVLRNHFITSGYVPDTIETGTVLDNGILLFRGKDADGRAAILLLQGRFSADGSGTRVMSPSNLALIYAVDPDTPDIFRIKDGDF
ncbi:MAG: hypothetical protein AAF665_05175 [Pseudomonadota bacterium]